MKILLVTMGASLLVAVGFLLAFLWASRSGQFDDQETPAMRILFDDDFSSPSSKEDQKNRHNK